MIIFKVNDYMLNQNKRKKMKGRVETYNNIFFKGLEVLGKVFRYSENNFPHV